MLRTALVMPSSPQAQLQSDTFPADGETRSKRTPRSFYGTVLPFLAEDLDQDALLPLFQDLKPCLLKPDDSQLPGDLSMFLLLHFGKGKADVQASIDKPWKAPLLPRVFL